MRDLLKTTVELSVVAYFSFSLVALPLIFWLTISDLKIVWLVVSLGGNQCVQMQTKRITRKLFSCVYQVVECVV